MLVGYMRVSSENERQNTDLQYDALIKVGVDSRNIYQDKASGVKSQRVGLKNALDFMKKGDCLIVWKLDRLGRYNNLPTSFNSHGSYEVVKLFFKNSAHKFKEFSNKEIPSVINQWLSNLYLSNKSHKLYLTVEDKSEEFELNVKFV